MRGEVNSILFVYHIHVVYHIRTEVGIYLIMPLSQILAYLENTAVQTKALLQVKCDRVVTK